MRVVREWTDAVIPAAIIALIFFYVLWPFHIEGPSMEPSFTEGNRIAISRMLKFTIKHGDIIVCKYSTGNERGNMLKRVIGLPGDNVKIENGEVMLNGERLEEKYINNKYTEGKADITLGADEYFVLGDNREISCDSRLLGAVKRKELIGKVIIKLYPEFCIY